MMARTISRITAAVVLAASIALPGCSRTSIEPAHVASDALPGGRIAFVHGYRQGSELARQQGKPMLLFFTAEWCTYCHAMEREALRDPRIVQLADSFVCVVVDADAEPDVCRLFRVRGYPTVQFISPRGAALNRLVGKQPAAQLSLEMQAALQAIARRIDLPSASHAL